MAMKKYENVNPIIAKFLTQLAEQNPPPLYTLTPQKARETLDYLQASSVDKIPVSLEDVVIPGKITKDISLRIIRPQNSSSEILPVIIFVHGAGWILGNKNTHDYFARSLAIETHAAVIFVEYSLSPEAHYPVAIEQIYETLEYIAKNAKALSVDGNRIAIVGDSVGGLMATVVAQRAKDKAGPKIIYQALLYPVTDANFDTASYKEFADNYWLTKRAMEWFWDAYAPDKNSRTNPDVSPLRASIDQLKNSPATLIITNENDVLRDEAESYAHKLMQAGVDVCAVRNLGSIHDIALLAPLIHTPQAKLTIAIASLKLKQAFSK